MNKLQSILFAFEFWMLVFLSTLTRILTLIFFVKSMKKTRRKKTLSVVFLENFPGDNAGYYYRSKAWADLLNERNFKCTIKNVFERDRFEKLLGQSLYSFMRRFMWKRFFQVLSCLGTDVVVVRRELLLYNDYGNLFLERLLLGFHPAVILDFDDDISSAKGEPRENISLYGRFMLESRSKFASTLKMYHNFLCGSGYLRSMVKERNPEANALVVPTCVDYSKFEAKQYPPDNMRGKINLGWIGSDGNKKYLIDILPDIEKLSQEYDLELTVIAGSPLLYEGDLSFIVNFEKWSLKSQIDQLRKFDIGIMPLPNNNISRGKCGFKLIQYMGLGIVPVASSVGVNPEIVDDGVNGFLVPSSGNWEETLNRALREAERFREIGSAAREKVMKEYSFDAHLDQYAGFLQSVANKKVG